MATKKSEPDPRSEALRHIDKIIAEASEGLHADDVSRDPTVLAARAARRLIEQSWTTHRYPEWKVRFFWETSDVIVFAASPSEAKNAALTVVASPTASRIIVLKENPERKWETVAEFKNESV